MSRPQNDASAMTSHPSPAQQEDPLPPLSPPTRHAEDEIGTSNPASPHTPASPASARTRKRASTTGSVASNASSRIRAASIKILEADPPPGFMAGLGSHASKAPTISEIRRGSYSKDGWSPVTSPEQERQSKESSSNRGHSGTGATSDFEERATTTARPSLSVRERTKSGSPTTSGGIEPFPALVEEGVHPMAHSTADNMDVPGERTVNLDGRNQLSPNTQPNPELAEKYNDTQHAATTVPRQYETSQPWTPPPKLPWTTSLAIGLRSFAKWVLTIPGFLITVYGLNVVAWGGMLFLLLCNAAPAMCRPTCNDINSPRRIWIEIDSQILNALFCVTGFGLAPWRFRDLYWWGWWRLGKNAESRSIGIRRLAGIHRGWFRLPGSDKIIAGSPEARDPSNPALPIPISKAPPDPLTTVRATPTDPWRMDYVVWCNIMNTFLQAILSGFMWGLNRYTRPSWSTGLFVGLAMVAAAMGGLMVFQEGKKVKKVEGVEISVEEKKARGWDVESVRGEATAVGAAASDGIVRGEEVLRQDRKDLKHKAEGRFG